MESDTAAVRNVVSSPNVQPMMITGQQESGDNLKEKVAQLKAQLLHAIEQYQHDLNRKQDRISYLLEYITRLEVENTNMRTDITNLKHKKSLLETDSATQTDLVKTQTDDNYISSKYETKMKRRHKKQKKKLKEAKNEILHQCNEIDTMQSEITSLNEKQHLMQDTILDDKQQLYKKDLEYQQIKRSCQDIYWHCKQQEWNTFDLQSKNRYLESCVDYYKDILESYRLWNYYENQAQNQHSSKTVKNQSANKDQYQKYYQTYPGENGSNCTLLTGEENAIIGPTGELQKGIVASQTIKTEQDSMPAQMTSKSKNNFVFHQSSAGLNSRTQEDTVLIYQLPDAEIVQSQLNQLMNTTPSLKTVYMQKDSMICKPLHARISQLKQSAMFGGSPNVSVKTSNFQQLLTLFKEP